MSNLETFNIYTHSTQLHFSHHYNLTFFNSLEYAENLSDYKKLGTKCLI